MLYTSLTSHLNPAIMSSAAADVPPAGTPPEIKPYPAGHDYCEAEDTEVVEIISSDHFSFRAPLYIVCFESPVIRELCREAATGASSNSAHPRIKLDDEASSIAILLNLLMYNKVPGFIGPYKNSDWKTYDKLAQLIPAYRCDSYIPHFLASLLCRFDSSPPVDTSASKHLWPIFCLAENHDCTNLAHTTIKHFGPSQAPWKIDDDGVTALGIGNFLNYSRAYADGPDKSGGWTKIAKRYRDMPPNAAAESHIGRKSPDVPTDCSEANEDVRLLTLKASDGIALRVDASLLRANSEVFRSMLPAHGPLQNIPIPMAEESTHLVSLLRFWRFHGFDMLHEDAERDPDESAEGEDPAAEDEDQLEVLLKVVPGSEDDIEWLKPDVTVLAHLQVLLKLLDKYGDTRNIRCVERGMDLALQWKLESDPLPWLALSVGQGWHAVTGRLVDGQHHSPGNLDMVGVYARDHSHAWLLSEQCALYEERITWDSAGGWTVQFGCVATCRPGDPAALPSRIRLHSGCTSASQQVLRSTLLKTSKVFAALTAKMAFATDLFVPNVAKDVAAMAKYADRYDKMERAGAAGNRTDRPVAGQGTQRWLKVEEAKDKVTDARSALVVCDRLQCPSIAEHIRQSLMRRLKAGECEAPWTAFEIACSHGWEDVAKQAIRGFHREVTKKEIDDGDIQPWFAPCWLNQGIVDRLGTRGYGAWTRAYMRGRGEDFGETTVDDIDWDEVADEFEW